jgi:hypothetical protein
MAREKRYFWKTDIELDPCVTSPSGDSHYSGGGTCTRWRLWRRFDNVIDGVEKSGPCP